MKVTITEQHLNNIIAESVKKRLFEFNHMLYGSEPEPETRCGKINFVEGILNNSEVELDENMITSVLNKFQLPLEMDVCYPESDALSDENENEFKELCNKIETINPSTDEERTILSQYLDAVYSIEDYNLMQEYYGMDLDVPDYEPDPDYEHDTYF